jgi:hypothetical protein
VEKIINSKKVISKKSKKNLNSEIEKITNGSKLTKADAGRTAKK